MLKSFYRDLAVILVLAILSMIWLMIPALNNYPENVIPYFLIILFLPGYSLLAVLIPSINKTGVFKRVILSIILSVLITISIALLLSYTPLITYKSFIFIIIPSFIVILSIIAVIRRRRFYKKLAFKRLDSIKGDVKIPDSETSDPQSGEKNKIDFKVVENKSINSKNNKTTVKRFYSLDILLVVILTISCAVFVLEPVLSKTVFRTIFGLLLVLFLPGYALIASLFPRKDDLDGVERLALSFGLSIAVTPLLGLALNYTSYGIRLDPILISLSGLTLFLIGVAYLRRRRIPKENRFRVDFGGFFKSLVGGFSRESGNSKVLSVILIVSILLAVSATGYIIVKPKQGESFTEFYILGPGGMASGYPTNLTSGETGNLIIGIVNHENRITSYHLVVTSNGVVQIDQMITLNNGQKLQIPFNFTAGDPGSRKMDFLLYKLPDNNNIYRSLHLWLNISASPTTTTVS